MTTLQRIKETVEKGSLWLKSKQNTNGSYGKWDLGSTSLAIMALLRCNISNSDPAVTNAISHILNSPSPDSTYFRALTVMALITNGEKTSDILRRVQTDTEWLIEFQCNNPEDLISFGGWGNSSPSNMANGSTTQFALLALYSASLWGLIVPQDTWSRALTWYQKNHDINNDGSYVYSLDADSHLKHREVLYAITSGAISSLKIINQFSTDTQIKSHAQNLINRALNWFNSNYTVELLPNVPDSWHYYYLYSLQSACIIEPCFPFIGTHDWYADITDYLMLLQKPDGKWVSVSDKKSTDIVYTSFALLTLSNSVKSILTNITCYDEDAKKHKHDDTENNVDYVIRYRI